MSSATKLCIKCNKELLATTEFFPKHSKTKSGLNSYCKSCQKIYCKQYYQQNKTYALKKDRENYKKNIEQRRAWNREWYKKNQQKIQAGQTILRRNKRRNNLQYRLACNLRNRLNKALKNLNKSQSTLSLLGCSTQELKVHLQQQFLAGMSWDNYGKWHIDHIRPCSSFDLSDPAQQTECFHYTNLQPLWAIDNLKKSDSWESDPKDT